ncbi:MAG: hypothetical protein J1E16_05940 [Muribaculaceae bacterium]|nr:hypothetical protein [Muribaculaceae bacterium]
MRNKIFENYDEFVMPSFSIKEMEEKLMRTTFSKEYLAFVSQKLRNKEDLYMSIYNKWSKDKEDETLFKIFHTERNQGDYYYPLFTIPYIVCENEGIHYIHFTIIEDGGNWYIVSLVGSSFQWYSGHCEMRFAERILNQPYPYPHYKRHANHANIQKMLVRNNLLSFAEYAYQGKTSVYSVGRDGIFFSIPILDSKIITSIIDRDKFELEQKEFFNEEVKKLNPLLTGMGIPKIAPIPIIYSFHRAA